MHLGWRQGRSGSARPAFSSRSRCPSPQVWMRRLARGTASRVRTVISDLRAEEEVLGNLGGLSSNAQPTRAQSPPQPSLGLDRPCGRHGESCLRSPPGKGPVCPAPESLPDRLNQESLPGPVAAMWGCPRPSSPGRVRGNGALSFLHLRWHKHSWRDVEAPIRAVRLDRKPPEAAAIPRRRTWWAF